MSSTPVSTGCFSILPISTASRCASGTPRRLIPTSPTFLLPPCFSTISCASRTSVRSISEADISLPFSRNFGFWTSVSSLITLRLMISAQQPPGRASLHEPQRNKYTVRSQSTRHPRCIEHSCVPHFPINQNNRRSPNEHDHGKRRHDDLLQRLGHRTAHHLLARLAAHRRRLGRTNALLRPTGLSRH